FSSRRRHTRFSRDWSSDVCSSDLSSPATTLEQIQLIDPLRIAKFRPGVPADVEAVIRRCLTKHPRRRYANARELADDLRCAAERSEERRVGKECRSRQAAQQ